MGKDWKGKSVPLRPAALSENTTGLSVVPSEGALHKI